MIIKKNTVIIILSLALLFVTACAPQGCAREAEVREAATRPAPVAAPQATSSPAWSAFRVYRIQAAGSPIHSLAMHPDGSWYLVGADADQGSPLMEFSDGSEVQRFELDHSLEGAAFSPDGFVLAASLGSYGVSLIDPRDGETIADLQRGDNTRMAFSPDGSLIATSAGDNKVHLWIAADQSALAEIELVGNEGVIGLQFSPTRSVLAAQRSDCGVQLIDTITFEVIASLNHPRGSCQRNGIGFSPNGNMLAGTGVISNDQQHIRIWCMNSHMTLRDMPISAEVNDVEFSPDGSLLAAGLRDRTVVIWLLPYYEQLQVLALDGEGQSDWAQALLFAPDSRHLVIGRLDGSVEMWQLLE